MKKLFGLIGIKTNTGITIAFLLLGTIFLIAAFIVKISDNPPGILLMFLGVVMLIFSFIHNWSDSKKFKHLAIYSIVGVPVFVILHNLFESMTGSALTSEFLNDLFSTLSFASFILAVIICPITLIVGVWGWVAKK